MQAGAQAALAKNGQTVDGNTLLVAISDSAVCMPALDAEYA